MNIDPTVNSKIGDNTLACPLCLGKLEFSGDQILCSNLECNHSRNAIPLIQNRIPVLVDFDRSILDENPLLSTSGESLIPRTGNKYDLIKKIFWNSSGTTRKNLDQFLGALPKYPDRRATVLIIGGGAIGNGAGGMYDDKTIDILSFDIYASPNTHFVADGHSLPIASGTIDGIWIQAVLEHVLYPHQVVSEILRVLKKDGVVYAETPFQQHVHEGPYDFTRFTESGHRLLFKDFRLLDSGFVSGFGSVVLWNIRYATWGITRSKKLGILASLIFGWVRLFDKLVPDAFNIDTASGVFFLGKKDPDFKFKDRDIIAHYKGYQRK